MSKRAIRKTRARRKQAQPQVRAAETRDSQRKSKHLPPWRMRDVRRLVRAIFSAKDPIEVGQDLLSKKGDATVAKVFTLLIEYLYGKPVQPIEATGANGEKGIFQFVTYAPRPQHHVDRNSEDQRNKEASRLSLSGERGAPINVADFTQEDGNDEHQ
jgi:hypothetical protein